MNKEVKWRLWVEKYRPKTLSDVILPKVLEKTFSDIIKSGEIPNQIFSGPPGTGKTTMAKVLATALGYDTLFINASLNGNIDTLRTTIKSFASTVSFSGKRKVVILDEADALNPVSTQPALRGFIEEHSKNCAFILTCNYPEKIISPLHGRAPVINFRLYGTEKKPLAEAFFNHVTKMLDTENITYDKKVVAELIKRFFPDFRRIIGELQTYSLSGTIDSGILSQFADVQLKDLVKYLKEKEFTKMTDWVVENTSGDTVRLYRTLYDGLPAHLNPDIVPQLILTLADFSYKAAFVSDQEINLRACLTTIMAECDGSWK